MVTTRSSSFSVPPLQAPTSSARATSSGSSRHDLDRSKVRGSNSHCPPRPPTSRKQRTSTQLNTNAGLGVRISDNTTSARLDRGSPRDFAKALIEPLSETREIDKDGHFLKGINVEKCLDLLSIPDPPTPKTAEKMQRKRRQSSPFILEPLKCSENDDISRVFKASKSHSRSRSSLSHLPTLYDSPNCTLPHDTSSARRNEMKTGEGTLVGKYSNSELRDVTNNAIDWNETRSTSRPKSEHAVSSSSSSHNDLPKPPTNSLMQCDSIELRIDGDNAGKQHNSSVKKRRESIVFPYELLPTERSDQKDASHQSPAGESIGPVVAVPQIFPIAERSAFDWDQIGQAIREYISLPPPSRSHSEQASSIETMTGYPLIPPSQKTVSSQGLDLNWSSSPIRDGQHVDAQRRLHFMHHAAPNIQKLETLKDQEFKDAEFRTNARIKKVKSKYHYYDTTTGRRIASEEYKQRYMAMLHENDVAIDSKAQAWLAGLPSCNMLSFHHMKRDEIEDRTSSKPLLTELDDMEPSTTDDSSDVKPEVVLEPILTDDKEGIELESISSMVSTILPLPDRDEESSDPEIAQAERKLWAAIDAALEFYSAEVVEILKSKGIRVPT